VLGMSTPSNEVINDLHDRIGPALIVGRRKATLGQKILHSTRHFWNLLFNSLKKARGCGFWIA
jgi:hypothetical protein